MARSASILPSILPVCNYHASVLIRKAQIARTFRRHDRRQAWAGRPVTALPHIRAQPGQRRLPMRHRSVPFRTNNQPFPEGYTATAAGLMQAPHAQG